MFDWYYKLIGKQIANKIGLEEKSMPTKKWYQSKAIWTAIVTGLLGAAQGAGEALGHPIIIHPWVIQILIGMGIYSLRVGDKPIA